MLQPQYCRARQRRLAAHLAEARLDAAVCAAPHHVYYLTGHWTRPQHQSAVVIRGDGRSWLVTANQPNQSAAADEVVAYESNWLGTARQEQPAVVAELAAGALHGCGAVGFDSSGVSSELIGRVAGRLQSIDPLLWQLRRRKDPDELALMKHAIRCTEAMYARARQIIEPGISEIEVYNQLHAAAVEVAAGPLTALLGNDFACGVGGGPPRAGKVAEAGQIYILDLGPAVRGYFADNCRAIAVDRKPTDEQLAAWSAIVEALAIVEGMARPGVRCRDLFAAVDAHFKQTRGTGMPHHLGHGVGLQPHEFPHLNPRWDDTLIEGEVFTAEPAQYGPALGGGIRMENQYLVTADGAQNLVNSPLELA